MVKLQPIPGTELSAYVVELLAKQEIVSIRDFMKADILQISKKSNLSVDCIRELRKMHCPRRLNLLQHYKNMKSRYEKYGFGIESLDNLLGNQTLNNNSVFEIFGASAIGKTRFCHSVTLNLVRSRKMDALYIDTKQDFSGSCLFQMMCAQNIERKECGQIMERIKVERTFSLQGVYDVLENLEQQFKSGAALVAAIKLVIIDSLPAIWFLLNGDEEHFERKYLACKIANLLHILAKEYFVATLLVNLAVQEELCGENADMSEFGSNVHRPSSDSNVNNLPLKPALGRYWAAVPHTRLCMKMADDADECADERLIEITRNSYGPSGGVCRVLITDAGVVS